MTTAQVVIPRASHVLRCFDNGNIVHVDGSVNPVRDKEVIDTELQLKDLETVESRIKRVEKQANVGGDKMAKVELGLLLRYKDALEQGKSARVVELETAEEEAVAKQMFLLTTKPVLNLFFFFVNMFRFNCS